MNFDEWFDTYRPLENPGKCGFEIDDINYMFETYGDDLSKVLRIHKSNEQMVWTLIECRSDEFLIEGYHWVNRTGYFIASVPWRGGQTNIPFT